MKWTETHLDKRRDYDDIFHPARTIWSINVLNSIFVHLHVSITKHDDDHIYCLTINNAAVGVECAHKTLEDAKATGERLIKEIKQEILDSLAKIE